jgi:hypothetical protein
MNLMLALSKIIGSYFHDILCGQRTRRRHQGQEGLQMEGTLEWWKEEFKLKLSSCSNLDLHYYLYYVEMYSTI